jgi:glutaredoxin 2
MTTMKLYSWDLSPYSARVRMQIYAKGLTDIAIEQPPT